MILIIIIYMISCAYAGFEVISTLSLAHAIELVNVRSSYNSFCLIISRLVLVTCLSSHGKIHNNGRPSPSQDSHYDSSDHSTSSTSSDT